MRPILLILLTCGIQNAISQNLMRLGTTLFDNREVSSIAIFDTTNNWYESIHFSKFGDIALVRRADANDYSYVDTTFGFYQNGTLAFYRIYKNGQPHGNFAVFDSLGNIRYSGAYYKRYRIGVWKSFDENNKVTKTVKYAYSLSDSLLIDQNLSNQTQTVEVITDEIILCYLEEHSRYELMLQEFSYGIVIKVKCKSRKNYSIDLIYHDGINPPCE